MRRIAITAALLSCLSATACANYAGDIGCGIYGGPDLTMEQLAGTWRGPEGGVLELRPDGTMSTREFPRPIPIPVGPPPAAAAEGTWQFSPEPDQGDLQLTYQLPDGPYGDFFSVTGSAAEPVLWQYADDPDTCRTYRLTRQ